jgi:peptidylprolyl isomerase
MAEGEKRTVRLDPKHTVGDIRPELIFKLPRYTVPEQHEDLTIGSKVRVEIENGNTISGRVSDLSDQEVTVDSNHRLAGKTLIFDVELIEFV